MRFLPDQKTGRDKGTRIAKPNRKDTLTFLKSDSEFNAGIRFIRPDTTSALPWAAIPVKQWFEVIRGLDP